SRRHRRPEGPRRSGADRDGEAGGGYPGRGRGLGARRGVHAGARALGRPRAGGRAGERKRAGGGPGGRDTPPRGQSGPPRASRARDTLTAPGDDVTIPVRIRDETSPGERRPAAQDELDGIGRWVDPFGEGDGAQLLHDPPTNAPADVRTDL